MSHIIAGSKMLILLVTFIVMTSINISSAGETTKANEIIESTILTKMIHNIGSIFYGSEIEESRTFWRIKKLQSALLPLMFKLGVLATIVKIILILSLKAVLIGKLLLLINVGFIIAKVAVWKSKEQQPSWPGPMWPAQSWYPPQQPIHVHIHNDKEQPHYSEHEHQPYLPYSSSNTPYERYDNQANSRPIIVNYDDQYTDRRPPTQYYRKS